MHFLTTITFIHIYIYTTEQTTTVPYVLRFMIDNEIVGCNWIECPAATYKLRRGNEKVGKSQIELDIVYNSIISHKP